MKKIIILLFTLLLILCGCEKKESETVIEIHNQDRTVESKETYKSNLEYDKTELVYAKADASGKVYEVNVDVDLKNPLDEKDIIDKSDLFDIVNSEGDEDFISENGLLTFENKGSDIHYKGKSNKELPITMAISYYLNDKEISPKELAQKSGHLKIHIDYINNNNQLINISGTSYDVKIPFMCMTIMYLDSDIFSNLKVDSGKIINSDESLIILGLSLPGLKDSLRLNNNEVTKNIEIKDYFELEADVEGFELDYISTLISNGLFSDLKDSDFKDIDELLNKTDDFNKQKADIEKAKIDIKKMPDEFVNEFNDLKTALDNINNYIPNDEQLAIAIKPLTSEMNNYIYAYNNLLAFCFSEDKENQIFNNLKSKLVYDENVLNESGIYIFPTEKEALERQKQNLSEALLICNELLEETKKDLTENQLENDSDYLNALTINETVKNIYNLYMYYYDSIYLYTTVDILSESLDIEKLKSSMNKISDEMINSLNDFVKAIDNITKNIDGNLKNIVNRLKASKELDKQYQSFTGLVEGKSGNVSFIIENDGIK